MIRLGTPDQFRILRDFFRARFSEEIVSAALGVACIRNFDQRDNGRPVRDPLVQCLFGGAAVPFRDLRPVLPQHVGEVMGELGLLEAVEDRVWCPVVVYPTHGLYMISDRFTQPDGSPFTGDREFVYFALTENTQNYIQSLPTEPCEAFLDLGAGNGAAALIQARYSGLAVSSDISPRSCLFAEFNRRLNDLSNVQVVEGSLYEAVEGRVFDRIGCHPPYDMSGTTPWTFADGGDDGEFVIRGVISGLPDYLRPGGEFTAQFRAADRKSQPLQNRIREWLGPLHEEFDVAVVVRSTVSPEEYAVGVVMSTTGNVEQYRGYLRKYEEMGVEQLAYCNLLIRRKSSASAPLTLRRAMGQRCGREELAWLQNWESAVSEFDISGMVISPSPGMEILVRHKPVDGAIQPVEYTLTSSVPFEERMPCPQWIVLLVSECAEHKTAAEVYAAVNTNGAMEPQQFQAAVLKLVSAGMLQLS
ncbi:MAG: methyltransferase [Bryobacteraceae bacterium]|nr:methyltransferase [Bryobacteraceae bacterium]